jgi:hypothetical protein
VLPAKAAVLVQLKTVGRVLLVLVRVVVALLALGAAQGDFDAHYGSSLLLASLLDIGAKGDKK